MEKARTPSIVVIGGGTGTSTVVSALKHLPASITALISVADSGGSTGRLRDEFGFQPVGDLRQSLAALAQEKNQEWIRNVLLYRFEKGKGLKGHNLGNLILTALQGMTGSTVRALEVAGNIFQLQGSVLPVTTENVQLVVEYEDGTKEVGEHRLDDNAAGSKKIKNVSLFPKARIYEKASKAIEDADLVVIGPGDYYSSIMPALAVGGVRKPFATTRANLVYIVNIMTRFTQTHGMGALEHVRGVEEVIGRRFDYILVNTGKISKDVLAFYSKEREYPVEDNMADDPRVLRKDVILHKTFKQSAADIAHRSILRHDPGKLSLILKGLV